MSIIGEVAATLTSFCWTISAIAFTTSSRQIGSQVVNRIRVIIAFVLLLVVNWIFLGQPIPIHASADHWFWLMLSGVVGLAIGDTFLFRTYQLIGARLGLLMLSLAPVFSILIAWAFMGEVLTAVQVVGIILTLAGVSWVVVTRPKGEDEKENPHHVARGILFGVVAALCQAGGLVLSSKGMMNGFHPLAGTLIRMITAVIILWTMALFQKKAKPTLQAAIDHPKATQWVALGAVFGPVIGIAFSLLAVQYAKIGVASTLIALPPVFILPVSYFIYKERLGWQTLAGTILSIAGVAVLFMK